MNNDDRSKHKNDGKVHIHRVAQIRNVSMESLRQKYKGLVDEHGMIDEKELKGACKERV